MPRRRAAAGVAGLIAMPSRRTRLFDRGVKPKSRLANWCSRADQSVQANNLADRDGKIDSRKRPDVQDREPVAALAVDSSLRDAGGDGLRGQPLR